MLKVVTPALSVFSVHWLMSCPVTFQDMYGFNLAGLQSIRHEMETAGTPVFADVAEKLQRARKKKKLTSYKT